MKLKVLGSSSDGNCYILEDTKGMALIIDAGIQVNKVKRAVGFKLNNIVGCLVTHSHGDHSKYAKQMMKESIDVFATAETHREMRSSGSHGFIIQPGQRFSLGEYSIKPFELKHDVKCVGFLITHPESGLICFISDTYYCEYTFPGVNNFIVEANYSLEILQRRTREGENPKFLEDRIVQSHLSLENCKKLLAANDMKRVNNIVLIHLSKDNSNAHQFQEEIQSMTLRSVTIAEPGLVMELNETPF